MSPESNPCWCVGEVVYDDIDTSYKIGKILLVFNGSGRTFKKHKIKERAA